LFIYLLTAMVGYRAKIERDLRRWEASGWLDRDGANAIRAELAAKRVGFELASTLAILGAVLLGFAAMSFVAANWQLMSKLARLLLLFCGLSGSYAIAAALFKRSMPAFGHAVVLLAVTIFGAAIMLIAQMYHIEGSPTDAVLLWAMGALGAGLMIPSNPALAAALALFGLWSSWEMTLVPGVHWAFLLSWTAVASGFAMTRWRPALHLLSIAMSAWIIALGYRLSDMGAYAAHEIVVVIGLLLSTASILVGRRDRRNRRVSGAILGYGMVLTYAGLFALQFIVPKPTDTIVAVGALTLVLIVGALVWAIRAGNRLALWIAYSAFSIEIFALYTKKLGSLMGTSAFFFVAGLIVIALSMVAYRLHGRSPTNTGAAA
jgi:uncharacterized membrane protein